MTFETLKTINEMLEEDLKRRNNALNLVREKRNKDENLYDDMIAHDDQYTEEEFATAKKHMELSKELYDKAFSKYINVKDALNDFNAHEWR